VTARYHLTLQARQDLAEIAESIAAEGGLEAAESVVETFRESFRLIAGQPAMFARILRRIHGLGSGRSSPT
jgi:plasmid stabilization system protein ParE